jgi:tRNA (guanine-N7-)-methyltransferase
MDSINDQQPQPVLRDASKDRKIRSFIRRQGRMTAGQQAALEQYWDKFCLNPAQPLIPQSAFLRTAPVFLEIGFGNGDCLAQMSANNPHHDYIGIEVHRPGIGHLLIKLEQQASTNVRVYCHDAIEVLERCLPDSCLDGVHLFFPDPWPKLKHHKRRIVQPAFLNLLAQKLKQGGYFHAATDWEHYAHAMLKVLSADKRFHNTSAAGAYCERPEYRPLTKFENRGLRLGHGVWDLIFTRTV